MFGLDIEDEGFAKRDLFNPQNLYLKNVNDALMHPHSPLFALPPFLCTFESIVHEWR